MDETPFYKRPGFYIAGWLAFLLLVYGAQIYRMGGVRANLYTVLLDLFCIFPLFLLLWMAFFSQFVLPVKTLADRQKIFERLLSHLTGGHGPALFIRNGEIIKREGEEKLKGPGVLWLDSASAAVTRTPVSIRQIVGPGVHFTNTNEYVEPTGVIDLHVQTQKLGPREGDRPFDEKRDDQSKESYQEVQNRRKQVTALTRDGIEVIPDISVTFRVNTGFPAEGAPGSRFGYRTGNTRAAKRMEARDQEAIRRAILGEGINPNIDPESSLHRVAWNRLPAMLAVDLWREYTAKFTLDELFKASQEVLPVSIPPSQSMEEEIDPNSQPLQFNPNQRRTEGMMVGMLREMNRLMDRAIRSLEREDTARPAAPSTPPSASAFPTGLQGPISKTAFQVINDMVLARLTQPVVQVLDDTGRRTGELEESKEFVLLENRGLKVQGVSISNIRLNPKLEEQLIQQWSSNWLRTAKAESEQLDRKRNVLETTSQEQANVQYAKLISREIDELARRGKPGIKELLKALLLRSRAMIRSGEHSDQLRRRMTMELQEIEDIIQWLEGNVK